jgi:hypothetical protein|tara:strand:- start:102 stop:344 length:243 start_codon:yes stop_codon:yes gene_type:complete
MAKRMRESRGLGKYDAPLKLQHQMGYSGFKRGRIANPFSEDTMQYREWNRGFSKAFYDNLSRITKDETTTRSRSVLKGEV